MCIGGSQPKPLPPPAQAAPVTSATPELSTDMYDNEVDSEKGMKKRKGKKDLRIDRVDTASVNIPGATASTNSSYPSN